MKQQQQGRLPHQQQQPNQHKVCCYYYYHYYRLIDTFALKKGFFQKNTYILHNNNFQDFVCPPVALLKLQLATNHIKERQCVSGFGVWKKRVSHHHVNFS
jgi:hypothetical protein